MVLPVYIYGHPVLRQETEDIEPDYPGLEKLIKDMWETMYFTEGVGLAAPQIGKSISLIVIDGSVLAEDFPECKDSKMCLINPELEVIEDMEPVGRNEGCLSLPGMSENVKRVEHVRLNCLMKILWNTKRNLQDFFPALFNMNLIICWAPSIQTIYLLFVNRWFATSLVISQGAK